jgi:ribosomal-protein-alanine N-acetyltransferase
MQQEDVEGVMAIENAVVDFPWTYTIFSDCIKVGYSCWVLEKEGEVLGYGLLSMAAKEAHILNICIHPDRQRLGLGRRMMHHLIAQAKRLQADSVYLEVRVSNQRAFNLYDSLGFKQIGYRKDYYPAVGGREDALVLGISFS